MRLYEMILISLIHLTVAFSLVCHRFRNELDFDWDVSRVRCHHVVVLLFKINEI